MQDRAKSADDEAAEDARLVGRALNGRTEAFDALARRYQRRVFAVAYRLLSHADDAADVAQDALIKAYRSLDQLTDHSRFGPWLMRIVTNLSLNRRRSRSVSATTVLEEGVAGADALRFADGSVRSSAAGSESTAGWRELHAAIATAIEALPDKQRIALVLSSVEGVPQKDIAQMLGCSVELVKWNVFQARAALRRSLADFLPSRPS